MIKAPKLSWGAEPLQKDQVSKNISADAETDHCANRWSQIRSEVKDCDYSLGISLMHHFSGSFWMQYMMIVCISRKVAVIASQFGFKASKIFFVGHQMWQCVELENFQIPQYQENTFLCALSIIGCCRSFKALMKVSPYFSFFFLHLNVNLITLAGEWVPSEWSSVLKAAISGQPSS